MKRKDKSDYYDKHNHKTATDNKIFWKTVKPFFMDKGVNHNRILLVEENWTISDNDKISEKLKNFLKTRIHCEIFLSDYFMKFVFHDSFTV